jgi:tripartite-type tricarboxylate transporter receptor subunit TctC
MNRREFLLLGGFTVSAGALPARAQGKYPDHPIRLVVPFAPGGVNDTVGRPWAEHMKPLLGPMVIENMGGAGGMIGAAAVAKAPPDGYTLLLGSGGTHVIAPLASWKPTYDPIKDFEPIAILGVTGVAIAVNPSLPVHNLKELIADAKAHPGKLSYGSAGTGTIAHLTGELFKRLTGITDLTHVPYRGAGPALADAISGQIPIVLPNVTGQVLAMHKAGKLRILAVTTPKRMAVAPDIPTAVESGLPEMISQNFIAPFAPAGTPRAIIEQIAKANHAVMADAAFTQRYRATGFEPDVDSGPDKAMQFLRDEIARWSPVIKEAGLKAK